METRALVHPPLDVSLIRVCECINDWWHPVLQIRIRRYLAKQPQLGAAGGPPHRDQRRVDDFEDVADECAKVHNASKQ